jgi:NAD(P)-dependent dehydrogenase (short-subunit alcohol dehydrogenase family)
MAEPRPRGRQLITTDHDLAGQVALVTGAGRPRGIGQGIALALAARGADVVVTDIRTGGLKSRGERSDGSDRVSGGLKSLVRAIQAQGTRGLALVGDIGLASDTERLVADALGTFGRIDILVNNAAAPRANDRVPVASLDESDWNRVISTNLTGTFLVTRAVLRHMLARGGGGRIISLSSTSGKVGAANEAAYSATKFGIIGFTQSTSREVASAGITVNAVCPGLIETDRVLGRIREEYPDLDLEVARRDRVLRTVPVGRIGSPSDVANLVVFLASPASSFITGQAYNVCGGEVMH